MLPPPLVFVFHFYSLFVFMSLRVWYICMFVHMFTCVGMHVCGMCADTQACEVLKLILGIFLNNLLSQGLSLNLELTNS